MEKFGIFELLDALAALTEKTEEPKEEPKTLDPAYLPPDYAGENKREQPPEQPKPPKPEADALAGFYARHDAVAKKAKK